MANARIGWIDLSKGFAIICVVLGHALDDGSALSKLIYSFHMPFFFISAGYLLNLGKWGGAENFGKFAAKLFNRLLMPYFIANLSFYQIWFVVCHKLGYWNYFWEWDTIKPIESFMEIFIGDGTNLVLGQLWFLPTLFLAQIILIGLYNRLSGGGAKIFVLAVVIVSCVGLVVKDFVLLPLGLDIALVMQIFLLIGLAVKRFKILERLTPTLCGVLTLILLGAVYFNEPIDFNSRIYRNPLLTLASGVTGTLLIMKISALMTGGKIFSLISDCGRQSMMIMVLHSIVLNITYDVFVRALNFPAEEIFTDTTIIFVATALSVLIPLFIAKRFGHLPVLKHFCAL